MCLLQLRILKALMFAFKGIFRHYEINYVRCLFPLRKVINLPMTHALKFRMYHMLHIGNMSFKYRNYNLKVL